MQFTFESSVSSNFGRLSKLDCFCPYLSVFVLDCVPLILFLWNFTHLGPPRGFGDLGRMAIYFQGAGEHW